MTKEAMIKVLRYKAEHIKTKIRPEFFAEVADTLGQEPCEDTISRADAVKVASGYCHPSNIAKELAKLPPVTPKPKVGHWRIVPYEETMFCSECNCRLNDEQTYLPLNYCPNCGAKMIEQQGSEG